MTANTLHSFFRDIHGKAIRCTPMTIRTQTKHPLAGLKPDWSYLLPVACVVGVCSVLTPYFAFGFAVGLINLTIFNLLKHYFPQLNRDKPKDDGMDEYVKTIAENSLYAVLWGPIFEEIFFRCALQPLLIVAFILAAPTLALMPVLSTGLSLAAVTAIACTSITFGLMHLINSKNHDNYGQVLYCIMGGIIHGLLAVLFSPAAAIAAHIANNTAAVTMLQLVKQYMPDEKEATDEAVDDSRDFISSFD